MTPRSSNKFYPGLDPKRTITMVSGMDPYLNSSGGTAGNQASVSYDQPFSRPRPKGVDLIRSGTAMAVEVVTEVNPTHTTTVVSGDTTIITQFGAHNAANAGAVHWSDDEPLVSSQTQARNILLSKIKNETVNLGTNLLEVKATARSIGDFARNVSNVLVQPKMKLALRLFRTYGSSRSPRKRWSAKQWIAYSKDMSDKRTADAVGAYFSYIYGLKPMMGDITNAVSGLQDLYGSDTQQFKTIKAQRTIERRKSVRVDPQSDIIYNHGGYVNGIAKASTRIDAMYRIDATSVKAASEFGITNPASAVYNAIPYSFVLDWIVPIGDYLNTLDASVGVSEFISIENSIYVIATSASSGHELNITRKYRSAPSTMMPGFTLSYQPSTWLPNAANGILLLKQRYQ